MAKFKRLESLLLPYNFHIEKARERAFVRRFRNDPFPKVMMEIGRVKDNPRALVLVSHGFLEMMIDLMISAKCRNGKKILSNGQTYSHSAKLLILNEIGAISDHTYRVYEKFRKLRNEIAHNPLFDSKNIDIDVEVEKIHIREDRLYEFCEMSIITLWNSDVELFAPKFAPTVMGSNN